ncbi:hypothetical protein T484DRAFT_2608727 [Baffinella frigidus]|nr:hypothetical protein T484DRAFT_2608727 [Cryptophyta sp. CCMP2293]
MVEEEELILAPRKWPRMVIHDSAVESPRIRQLLVAHPNITLDETPPRAHRTLNKFSANLKPYSAGTEHADVILYHYPRLTIEANWDKSTVSVTRMRHDMKEGGPKFKMDDGSNGFFDGAITTLKKIERETTRAKKDKDMEQHMAKARSKLAEFRAVDRQAILEEKRGFAETQARLAEERKEQQKLAQSQNVEREDEETEEDLTHGGLGENEEK